jgi:sulfite exporter TauE/SafE
MISAILGFAAGLIHVLTGPDHLAAVSPLAIENKDKAPLVGFKWGIGHTGGVCLLGSLALALREIIPMNLMSGFSERIIGIILIGIGLWGIRRAYYNKIHFHYHEHDGNKHIHFHSHGKETSHETSQTHFHTHAAFAVGIMHGFAGTSHIFGIVPALAFTSRIDAVFYLLFFGIGTVTAMTAFAFIIGYFSKRLELKGTVMIQSMLAGFSAAAILIGFYWILF